MDASTERAPRRAWQYALYVLIWLVGSVIIAVPVLSGLAIILDHFSFGMRVIFYAMPPLLSGLLVLGVLQIIAMYRYWFGPR